MQPKFYQGGDFLYKLTAEKVLSLNVTNMQVGVMEIILQFTNPERWLKKQDKDLREIPQQSFEDHLRLALGPIMEFGHPHHLQYAALNKMIKEHGLENISLLVKEKKGGKK